MGFFFFFGLWQRKEANLHTVILIIFILILAVTWIYEILLFSSVIGRFNFLNTLFEKVKCENDIINVNPINFILYILDLI